MNLISAVILTRNEEKNLERCLKTLDFCDEIIIVDDQSSDDTLEVAESFKAKIFKRELKGDFAAQRNFGQSKTTGKWCLFVDADEEVTPELAKEIKIAVSKNVDGFYLRRRDFFWGNEMKYGETRKVRNGGLLRLVRKESGLWLGNVHEVFHTASETERLEGFLDHRPHPTLAEFIGDVNTYSTLRARELFNRGARTNALEMIFLPVFKFVYNYFINFGFLDGAAGFAYSFMMSFHSFLVRAKLYQYRNIKT
jgi:glycosyltransferase involved in cell wall biosynthesis